MDDKYNLTAERLWEKLEYHRSEFNIDCVDFKQPFPADQFKKANPLFMKLVKEVQNEYNYIMSEFQASWAVIQFIDGGLNLMNEYNIVNNKSLEPRE